MKFKYRRINLKDPFSKKRYILRPIIPVSLQFKDKSIYYEALIDTGADFCIFPVELAKTLGINLNPNKIIYFSGISGQPLKGFITEVILRIGEINISTKIVFAESNIRVLGQRGFFDNVDVNLSHSKQIIDVQPAKLIH